MKKEEELCFELSKEERKKQKRRRKRGGQTLVE